MRFEDNLKYDLLHHPEKKYEHKLNLHPFIALLEKAENDLTFQFLRIQLQIRNFI